MDSDEASAAPRSSRRVAVAAEVRLEFERFTGFLEEMASNLSEGGMFVRTRNLRPVGSRLRFEIALSDQSPLVRGIGEVMWTRWRDGGPQEPAGMGIRFELLDSQSRELVERVVAEQRRIGRSPFDLDWAAPPSEAVQPPEPPEPENWFDLASRRDTEFLVLLPEQLGRSESSAASPDSETVFELPPWESDSADNAELSPEPGLPRGIELSQGEVAPGVEPSPDAHASGELAASSAEWTAPNKIPDSQRELGVDLAARAPTTALADSGPVFPEQQEAAGSEVEQAPVAPLEPVSWVSAGSATPTPVIARRASHEPGLEEFRSWLAPPAAAPSRSEQPPEAAGYHVHSAAQAEAARPTVASRPEIPQRRGLLTAGGIVAVLLVTAGVRLAWRESTTSVQMPARGATPTAASTAVAGPPPASRGTLAQPPAAVAAPLTEPAAVADTAAASATTSPFTTLERVTWEEVASGTVVTLWLDGAIAPDAVRQSRLGPAGGAREVLQLRGARRAFPTPRLEVGNRQVTRIRSGFHQRAGGDEQHVVLDLPSPAVRVLDLEVKGNRILVRLGSG